RPVGERRPTVGVVIELACPTGDEDRKKRIDVERAQVRKGVVDEVAAAAGAVERLATTERVLHSEPVERRAVKHPGAAEAEVGEQMRVRLDEAENRPVLPTGSVGLTLGVDRHLRRLRAAFGGV